MKHHPHVPTAFKAEFSNWRQWMGRAIVLAFAAIAGLTVVGFTWLTDHALAVFHGVQTAHWWFALAWTPASAAAIVWLVRRYTPGAAGSGIPQVMASIEPSVHPHQRGLFVSLKLSFAKMFLCAWGLLAGLSLGREGPSVQIAAGVLHHARRWIPKEAQISDQGLLIAGGAAGIAAAFNTPLGGVMFAIEELSKGSERRNNGLIIAAIVLSGLMAVSVFGNATYFGVIRVEDFGIALILPALLVSVCSGLAGSVFSRLLVVSLAGTSQDRFSQFRAAYPVLFAALCGLLIVVVGLLSGGATFGSGYSHSRGLLENQSETSSFYVLFKFLATWLTSWSGVPGGIFAPALSIGGALGKDIADLTGYGNAPTLIALGMAGFLAAATQAPLTAFIIVMEMVDGHALVLSLMTCTLLASGISRLISNPLYPSLAQLQLLRLPTVPRTPDQKSAPQGPSESR
jgi:H+/Cl- antiporter ClcA